jgi:hypothetical protein
MARRRAASRRCACTTSTAGSRASIDSGDGLEVELDLRLPDSPGGFRPRPRDLQARPTRSASRWCWSPAPRRSVRSPSAPPCAASSRRCRSDPLAT